MNQPQQPITKTCSNCGQQKPLAAFLQLSGQEGATYGVICATCRKTISEMPPPRIDSDEVTTSSTGVKIDSKTKVKSEIDKREWHKQRKEQELKEREIKEKLRQRSTEKHQTIAKDEKKHRETYLEKSSFLESTKKTMTPSQPIFGGEEQKANAGKLDFASGPVEITRVAGLIKTAQSPIFQAFKTWLGSSAPIVKAAERLANQPNQPSTEAKNPNPLNELAEKTLSNKSRK